MDIDYKAADALADQLTKNAGMISLNRESNIGMQKSFSEKYFKNYQDKFNLVCSFLKSNGTDVKKNQRALEFLKGHGFIFQNEEIIPKFVESGILGNILSLIRTLPSEVFDCLIEILSCPFENIIFLLKSGIGTYLIEGLNNHDDEIFLKSMKCFSIILSKRSGYDDFDAFLYFITISLDVINIIINRTKGKELNENMAKTLMKFSYNFFERISSIKAVNQANLNQLYENFFSECQDSCIYHQEIILKGISFSEDSKYYQLLIQSFSCGVNAADPQIIYDCCHIIYSLICYDIRAYTLFLDNLHFLDYSERWVKMNVNNIFKIYTVIVSYLLFDQESISLSPEHLGKISSTIFYIFDYSSNIDDEDLKLSIIISLQNLICWDETQIKNLLLENRIAIICSNIIYSSHRVAKYSASLYLEIASIIDDFSLIMNEEIIEKILFYMDKRKGDFVCSALHYLNLIFEKQQIQNKNDLLYAFMKFDGVGLLNDMINSDVEFISEISSNISSKYFS